MNQPRTSHADLSRVLDHLAIERQGALDRLFQFLAIPSVSTDPAYHAACVDAAEWCANSLREIGFQAWVEKTRGKPMVVGHWHGSGSPLRVLFYGHYDVQPPALAEWTAPPFAPRLAQDPHVGEVIVARGASDDKGQVMTFLEACRSWLAVHGRLPVDVTVLLEGEEESGSPSLPPPSSTITAKSSRPTFVSSATPGSWTPTRQPSPLFCAGSLSPRSP